MRRSKFIILITVFVFFAAGSFAQDLNPLMGISILLDPGHGGADPGAVGPTGLTEKEVNLRVARYLKQLLIADGAKVTMTRESDVYLSLGKRVKMAREQKPDLFVSIHHNASLKPVKKNVSEIYYNALDQGLSKKVGKKMITELVDFGFGDESLIIPGGFFVLRNNPSPAILTEGSYMTLPHIEKKLKTGKALTNQAQALRKAIQAAFKKGPLKVRLFASSTPMKIDTPYFNFLFTSNKSIAKIHVRSHPDGLGTFSFEKIPSFGFTYSLFNQKPLISGKYELEITFHAKDGSIAPKIYLPVEVNLPVANSHIKPVAPYIPAGFMGKFPVNIELKDQLNKINPRSIPVKMIYAGRITRGETSNTGHTTLFLELTGKEKHSIEVTLISGKKKIAQMVIPIKDPEKKFVLGKVVDTNNKPIANAKIKYGFKKESVTGPAGFFYCEYPKLYNNLKLNIIPPLGYKQQSYWLKTIGEPVIIPRIKVSKLSTYLYGKKIGIISPISFDNLLRKLVKEIMTSGGKVFRCRLPENQDKPEYQAVLEANIKGDLDFVFSFKRGFVPNTTLRHYHRGGKGKRLANAIASSLANANPRMDITVEAGSDYEINHTGATAVVVVFPQLIPPDYPQKVVLQLAEILKAGF